MRKSLCRETPTETIYNNKIVKMINILRDLLGTYVNCPCHSISEKPIEITCIVPLGSFLCNTYSL